SVVGPAGLPSESCHWTHTLRGPSAPGARFQALVEAYAEVMADGSLSRPPVVVPAFAIRTLLTTPTPASVAVTSRVTAVSFDVAAPLLIETDPAGPVVSRMMSSEIGVDQLPA